MSYNSKSRYTHSSVKIETGVNDTFVVTTQPGSVRRVATVAAGTYFNRGDEVTTAGVGDLYEALETALDALAIPSWEWNVNIYPWESVVGPPGHSFVKNTMGGAFSIDFTDGSFNFPGEYMGWDTSANTASATLQESDDLAKGNWWVDAIGDIETKDQQTNRRATRGPGGNVRARVYGQWDRQDARYHAIPEHRILEAAASPAYSSFETFWVWASEGGKILFWRDATLLSNAELFKVDPDRFGVDLLHDAVPTAAGFFSVTVPMMEAV